MSRRTLYPLSTWLVWVLGLPLLLIAVGFLVVAGTKADSLLFDNPRLWWLGGAGPVAGLIILYGVIRRRRALDRFASPQLAPLLAQRISPLRQALRGAGCGGLPDDRGCADRSAMGHLPREAEGLRGGHRRGT